MGENAGYYESRQHLNLSNQAYGVIEADKSEFMLPPSRQGLINKVISTYLQDSEAAIDNALARHRQRLEEQLAHIPENKTKKAVISSLLDSYRDELLGIVNDYPREHSFKI